jgi:hypothetical protein
MTIIETGDNTGVFVGTFSVPDYKGSDLELTYYDAKDAGGSAMTFVIRPRPKIFAEALCHQDRIFK